MQKVKWIFFAYLALVVLIVVGIGVSFAFIPRRDAHTLYTAYSANLKTLDPAQINDVLGGSIAGNIYECLYNYKYGVKPYELFPELAEDMPQVSKDELTWTIKLRKGIHFYDPDKKVFPNGIGPEVTAADVVYSWKRLADFHVASPNYSAIFQGRVVGLDDWWNYTKNTPESQVDYDRPVPGFSAVDRYTVRIRLTQPYPQLRYNLAYLPTAIVCRKVVEYYGDQFRKHPVGTGPYVLAEHLPEQRIVFLANPIYRGRPDVDGDAKVPVLERLPRIKRAQMDYFQEPMPVWLLFQQGLFDIAGIPKDSYHQAITVTGNLTPQMRKKGIELIKSTEAGVYYIGCNMNDPIVGKNKPLRQAMSMAIDRRKLIELFLNGRGEPAIGPIPPGFPTYDASEVNPYTQYNLKAAREKLREAERINGGPIPTLTLTMGDTGTGTRQLAEDFINDMAKIGINVTAEYFTWARFQERVDSGQAQLFQLGWIADYPDEQDFLQLFYGKNANGGINSTGYHNPEFDVLYEKAIQMEPSADRTAMYLKMEHMVMDDCPWLLTFYPVAYTLHYDWLKNLNDMDYGYGNRQYLSLDVPLRQKRRRGH